MNNRKNSSPTAIIITLICVVTLASCSQQRGVEHQKKIDTTTIPVSGEMKAELTSPPYVPAYVGDRKAKKLNVEMEILEKEGEMTDGVRYIYWTFGGSVPRFHTCLPAGQ